MRNFHPLRCNRTNQIRFVAEKLSSVIKPPGAKLLKINFLGSSFIIIIATAAAAEASPRDKEKLRWD